MEEDEYNKMLDHLQQYVPHLEKLITQLKDPKRKNRELQLTKLEGLYSMITDKRKKLKLDTLRKCEDVILKILQKVNPNLPKQLQQRATSEQRSSSCNLIKFVCKNPPENDAMALINSNNEDVSLRFQQARARLNEVYTPASPSPPRNLARNHSPILIPAEKISNDTFEKPDIYRLAAESLTSSASPNENAVDMLSSHINMSTPLLSEEDLKLLNEPEKEVCTENKADLSIDELESMREFLTKELIENEIKKNTKSSEKNMIVKDNAKRGEKSVVANKTNDIPLKDCRTSEHIPAFSHLPNRESVNKLEPTSKSAPKLVPPPVHKLSAKSVASTIHRPPPRDPSPVISKSVSPRTEMVLKDPISKFGDFLSRIDNQLLKDDSKKKDRKSIDDSKRKSIDTKEASKSESNGKLQNSVVVEKNNKDEPSLSNKVQEKQELDKAVPVSPVYKRLADKYNPKPRKNSTTPTEKPQLQETKNISDLRSPIQSPSTKWFDRDSNFELPCDKSNLLSGSPNQTKSFSSMLGNQYIPNPNALMPNKLPTQNQFMSPTQNHQSPHQNQYPLPHQNQFPVPKYNQYAAPHQNMMIPSQNMMVPTPNMISPLNVIGPPAHSVMTQHNSGGNTYLNTYIVQNNVNSNMVHGHYPVNMAPQNPYYNQIAPNKSFHPFDPIEKSHSSSKNKLQPSNSQNKIPGDPRKAISNSKHDVRSKDVSLNTRQDPRISKSNSKELVRRTSLDTVSVQNKYDTLYSNIDKDETFTSPLDSLYSTSETVQKTGKGYGFQNFRIPKKNNQPQKHNNRQSKKDEYNNHDNSVHEIKERSSRKARTSLSKPRSSPPPPPPVSNSQDDSVDTDDEPIVKERSSLRVIRSVSKSPTPPQAEKRKVSKGSKHFLKSKRFPKEKSKRFKQIQKLKKKKRKEHIARKLQEIKLVEENIENVSETVDAAVEAEVVIEVPSVIKEQESEASASTSTTNLVENETNIVKSNELVESNSEEVKHAPKEEDFITSCLAGLFRKVDKTELLSVILSTLSTGSFQQQQNKLKQIQKIVESNDDDVSTETKTDTNSEPSESKTDLTNSDVDLLKTGDDELKISNNLLETDDLLKTDTESPKLENFVAPITEEVNSFEAESSVPPAQIKKRAGRKRRYGKTKKLLKESSLDSLVDQSEKDVDGDQHEQIVYPEEPIDVVPASAGLQKKTQKRTRTELDRLHEDIKEMFIRDGILTATGQRMCRLLKSDETISTRTSHSKSNEVDQTIALTESPKRRARSSNPKVIIEQTDLTKFAQPGEKSTSNKSLTPTVNSAKDQSDTESDTLILRRRTLRQKQRLLLTSSSSESSLSSPIIRKFPKRKIKNKPNYYEDPNDLSVPKQPDPPAKEPEVELPKPTEKIKKSKVRKINISPKSPNKTMKQKIVAKGSPIMKSKITLKLTKLNKKLIKKKKPSWALGVIKKKKRYTVTPTQSIHDEDSNNVSGVEDNTENISPAILPSTPTPSPVAEAVQETDAILVEPDSNYYFDPQEKPSCKICPFKGKFIVQHYKASHPDYEVLISRISPAHIQQAIQESVDNHYEDIEVPVTDEKLLKQKFTYQCRFCHTFFKNEESETFFDHLTSHTGEYRFVCTLCDFKTSNSKSLRSHFHSSHTVHYDQLGVIVPAYETPSNYPIVFGYVCSECYFIQLNPAAIRNHMQIYHLGDNNTIFKISMSMIFSKRPIHSLESNKDSEKNNKVLNAIKNNEEPNSLENIGDQKVSEVSNKTKKNIINESSKSVIKSKATKVVPKNKLIKVAALKKKLPLTIVTKKKRGPRKKLKANDIVNEPAAVLSSNALEPEVVKVPEAVLSAKTELIQPEEITERLPAPKTSNKLGKKSNAKKQAAKRHFNVLKMIECRLEDNVCDVAKVQVVEESSANESMPNDHDEPSSSSDYAIDNHEKDLVVKNENVITDASANSTDDHLQDKELNSGILIPKVEEIILQVGPIAATKRGNHNLYSCNIENCMFETTVAYDFFVHCTNVHHGNQWNRFCNECDAVLENCGSEATDAYRHLINVHVVEESIKQEQISTNDSHDLYINSDSGLPFKILSVGTDEHTAVSNDFTCVLSDVRTLADESENFEPSSSMDNGSNVTLLLGSVSPPSLAPFTSTPVPALAPVSRTMFAVPIAKEPSPRSTRKVILRDTPMHADELSKDRKSIAAFAQLQMENQLANLYKCPEFYCSYSTDAKRSFECHLKEHSDIHPESLIPCLYCDFKTEFSKIGIHYDVRHSKCTFCCVYCFYRAVNQPYVEMHQDLNHHNKPRRVLVVPVNQDALLSNANIALLPMRDVVPPFLCSCTARFLFSQDIIRHTKSVHNGILTCGYCSMVLSHPETVTIHMQEHNVYYYHCRYCLTGASATDEIYKHLSAHHFAYSPQIVTRRFDQKKIDPKAVHPYTYDDDLVFTFLKIIMHDYYTYYTPSARKELGVSGPSHPTSRVYKAAGSGLRLSTNQCESTTGPNSRPNSPTVINKFLNFDTSLTDSISNAMNTATITPTTNLSNTVDSCMDVTSTETTATGLDSSAQKNNETFIEDITRTSTPVNVEPDKCDSLNATLSECDTSMENSCEVGDLTSSDSGETHFSDLTAEEASFTTCNSRKTGLTGKDLFKCSFCKGGLEAPRELKTHVIKCVELNDPHAIKPFKCVHCVKAFKNVNALLDHLRLHGTSRFSCSLCDYKAQHQLQVRQHMKSKHKISAVIIMPVDREKRDYDVDQFIIRPKINRQKSFDSSSKDSNSNTSQEDRFEKLIYTPQEIDSLPFRPIFAQDLGCSVCGYLTKVKANLVRHLHLHLRDETVPVPTSAPVNPVPCLEKNEKMFDKMTNLSHSGYNSNSSRMSTKVEKKEFPAELTKEEQEQIPVYVPSTKRNVCGATGCNYLCLDDNMFKRHLAALHGTETFYKCNHCDTTLCSGDTINVDTIIKHQKLHACYVYKCRHCAYLHHVKHKVEYHCSETHLDKKVNVVVIREMDSEKFEIPTYDKEYEREEVKESKPWHCGICKYRCFHRNEIVNHIVTKHELEEEQFKCALCTFKSNTMNDFLLHFGTKHPGRGVDVIDVYYKDDEKPGSDISFDTTPIWNLNRNSNCIRGIPIEGTKSPKKSPMKSTATDNLEKSIDSVATGTDSFVPKSPKPVKGKKPENVVQEKPVAKIKEKRRSTSIAKKLKMLKEKMNDDVEVIEIDDDDDDSPDVDKEDKIISVEEKSAVEDNVTIEVIENMDLDQLIASNLSGKHGHYGKPIGQRYSCPRCQTFKSSSTTDITHHLYKELGYFRFICTICRLYGISYKFLLAHSKNRHPHRLESIIPITPDCEVEGWVKKLIAVQSRIMNKKDTKKVAQSRSTTPDSSTPTPLPSATVEGTSSVPDDQSNVDNTKQLHTCPHCDYSTKYPRDLVKHERRHWLQKPLKCGHCDFEGVVNSDIATHCKRLHPNLEVSIISVPIPTTPTIQPISKKRKRYSPATSTTNKSNNESITDSDISHSESDDKLLHPCNYCKKKCITQEELDNHCKMLHSINEKPKSVTSNQPSKKRNLVYKCFYCEFIDNLESIKHHFIMEHPTLNLSVYRYQCPYCNDYFRKLEKIKAHCKQLHSDENPENLDIKVNARKSQPKINKQFVCKECSLQYDCEEKLVAHQRTSHADPNEESSSSSNTENNVPCITISDNEEMKLFKCPECDHSCNKYPAIVDHCRGHVKPVQCAHCDARFIYPSYAKAHCAKQHPNATIEYVYVPGGIAKLAALKKSLLTLKDGKYVLLNEANTSKRSSSPTVDSETKKIKIEPIVKPTARKSTTQLPSTKETARKSTTQIIPTIELDDDEDEGFTYYGT